MEEIAPEKHGRTFVLLDRARITLSISEVELVYLEVKIAEAQAALIDGAASA